ncbi:hypothetical protein JW868_03115 [Candidatus Woesearchaeota archaeon]|nr:hypothetical protein [Candidatus Woesearchaeota archaeon]
MNSKRVSSRKREFPEERFEDIDWAEYSNFIVPTVASLDEEREQFINDYLNEKAFWRELSEEEL